MPSHLFSSDVPHLSHSHYLAPPSLNGPPPPSYKSTASSGLKSSLRRIPSALFARSPPKKGASKGTKSKLSVLVDPDDKSSSMRQGSRPLPATREKEKTEKVKDKSPLKPKTKTRRALADILGWGSHHHSNIPSAQAPPAVPAKSVSVKAQAPPPPEKTEKPTGDAMQLRVHGLQPTAPASLRVPTPAPESLARASIGDDPFIRPAQGAQVVDKMPKKNVAPSVKSIATDRRTSVSSSKAMSARTHLSDEASIKGAKKR